MVSLVVQDTELTVLQDIHGTSWIKQTPVCMFPSSKKFVMHAWSLGPKLCSNLEPANLACRESASACSPFSAYPVFLRRLNIAWFVTRAVGDY